MPWTRLMPNLSPPKTLCPGFLVTQSSVWLPHYRIANLQENILKLSYQVENLNIVTPPSWLAKGKAFPCQLWALPLIWAPWVALSSIFSLWGTKTLAQLLPVGMFLPKLHLKTLLCLDVHLLHTPSSEPPNQVLVNCQTHLIIVTQLKCVEKVDLRTDSWMNRWMDEWIDWLFCPQVVPPLIEWENKALGPQPYLGSAMIRRQSVADNFH